MGNVSFNEEEEKAFKNAGREVFPDGQYQGKLMEASVVLAGHERKKKLILSYEIESPHEHKGSIYNHFLSLDQPKILWLVKKNIASFGIDTSELRLADLEEVLLPKRGYEVHFTLTTNGKYQNAELDGVISPKNELPDFNAKDDIDF